MSCVSQSVIFMVFYSSFLFLFFLFSVLPLLFDNTSLPDHFDARKTCLALRVHITTCRRQIHCSLHIHVWQVTVNRNSDSLLIHNFQPWQRSSGNSIKSSTIVLNRYSFRPQFNQPCMFWLKCCNHR